MSCRNVCPAAINKAMLRLLDPRDGSVADRLQVLNDENGVWRSHTQFNCVAAFPQEASRQVSGSKPSPLGRGRGEGVFVARELVECIMPVSPSQSRGRTQMAINIEDIVEKAFEQAFSRALDQTLQSKAEVLFKKAFENGSDLSKKLEEKIEQGFQQFVDHGIQWEKKKKPGFKR